MTGRPILLGPVAAIEIRPLLVSLLRLELGLRLGLRVLLRRQALGDRCETVVDDVFLVIVELGLGGRTGLPIC